MGERPILFSGPMVRAILAGRKTMTRRVFLPLNRSCAESMAHMGDRYRCEVSNGGHARMAWSEAGSFAVIPLPRCPFGAPGDRLWVRETHAVDVLGCDRGLSYRADHLDPQGDGPAHPMTWRPSVHMPREASRITLEVTGVRVERLQAITTEDVLSEGVHVPVSQDGAPLIRLTGRCATARYLPPRPQGGWTEAALLRAEFASLWDSRATRGLRWADDPWVWVVSFKRVEVVTHG